MSNIIYKKGQRVLLLESNTQSTDLCIGFSGTLTRVENAGNIGIIYSEEQRGHYTYTYVNKVDLRTGNQIGGQEYFTD